ncbi:hypothetical protein [Aliiglaciecola sp. LCG003]|uniref:hypothetical protein n=1 Tax=Aliiglaciecola sp. LCG003 TaxID=3053655 RepID=UPI00257278D9|nr:hypothetical protein [Aliiglaciecola sp. LCG003]WJG07622.1 hypothetical protein QR722_09590 [Aliiglaciecola sp. LCG003]
MSGTKKPNILEGLEIGSIVFGQSRKIGATVIHPGITAINNKIQKTKDVVTSNSHYVHNANLNEANLSISGSYGVSAVSQVEAGLSATASREASDASNALSIEMQRFVTSGIEYIDFDSLKPEEFIAALKGAPDPNASASEDDSGSGTYARMMRVVIAYNELLFHSNADDPAALLGTSQLAEWLKAK